MTATSYLPTRLCYHVVRSYPFYNFRKTIILNSTFQLVPQSVVLVFGDLINTNVLESPYKHQSVYEWCANETRARFHYPLRRCSVVLHRFFFVYVPIFYDIPHYTVASSLYRRSL